ncbi:hypothetical protein [Diaphorobacter caeni]|uniref:hypothetical protein n=1 Tax=Diaphorobacter caeni TaxID=2784387 RepID=UPI00188E3E6C|nr:hypothetical protein [Diaphorobacter caeni]MBF5006639.1 hypothetical protein [Diaphorobacter caeni]
MKAKLQTLRALAVRNMARVCTAGALVMAATGAHAQATGIDSLFDQIDLSGLATKILALAAIIVTIAFVIKGPSIVKRIISKI